MAADIDVSAETENLALYLSSASRSNHEADPAVWTYGDIEASFSDFNWQSDGWQLDGDGITAMRVSGDARLTIPYKPFARDFRTTGKTIEIEFSTREVLDYDAVILSCMDGGRGIRLTAQNCTLSSEQSSISMSFKEEEHVRVGFVVEKRSGFRRIYCYINGIMSGVVQYPADDDFSQVNPANITVGSPYCTTDIRDTLKERGRMGINGNPLRSESIRAVLKHEEYTGVLIMQKNYNIAPGKQRVNRGELPMYRIEAHHEPIISEELFAQSLKSKEKRRRVSLEKISHAETCFTGKIRCGKCGFGFSNHVHYDKKRKPYWTFSCNTRGYRGKAACDCPGFGLKKLEKATAEVLGTDAFEDEFKAKVKEVRMFDKHLDFVFKDGKVVRWQKG